MKTIFTLLVLATALSVSAQSPTNPTPNAPTTTIPETPAIVKARFAGYKAEQKESLKLAKLQTKIALEQIRFQEVQRKGATAIAVAQAKAK
jgi:hypothetical protein